MFSYTLLSDLQRNRSILEKRIFNQEWNEYFTAIDAAQAFVEQYGLTKEDIYPSSRQDK